MIARLNTKLMQNFNGQFEVDWDVPLCLWSFEDYSFFDVFSNSLCNWDFLFKIYFLRVVNMIETLDLQQIS